MSSSRVVDLIENGRKMHGDRRGSPSEAFSQEINDAHKNKKKRIGDRFTRTMAILCSVLATIFLISTIVLAIVVAQKSHDQVNTLSTTLAPLLLPPQQQAQLPSPSPNTSGSGNNGLIYDFNNNDPNRVDKPVLQRDWPLPSGSLYARYKKAAVASDHGMCSEIGRDVLIDGGNAVDSVIATLLCIGVVNPQSSGLGGGFLMTMYNASTGRCQTINARETAPAAAYAEMYLNDTNQSVYGYRSIATPSELHGYWTVFKKYGSGKVTWSRLFEPSIILAHRGFPVSSNLAMVLTDKEDMILAEPTMKEIFVDPATNRVYEEGDILKRDTLGFTLELIANATDPIDLFYKGGMAQTIATEITDQGGHVTLADLSSYETLTDEHPIVAEIGDGLAMCGPPPPSSFVITQSIIAIMAEFYSNKKVDLEDPLVYHRLIEAEKFAYAQRTKLGDVKFVESARKLITDMTKADYARKIAGMIKDKAQPQAYYLGDDSTQSALDLDSVPDHGTSHVAIIDEHGNAISTTSTINQLFGSMRASPTLGILYNDQMDDFSTPGMNNAFGFAPSPSNYIAPGKRPMSSMSPMVVYNTHDNRIEMVTGASGGSYIISATAQTVIRTLMFNQTVKEAVDAPRFHNQYLPHVTQFENTVPKRIADALTTQYGQNMSATARQKSVVQALQVMPDGFIHGNSDFRRQTATYPAGF